MRSIFQPAVIIMSRLSAGRKCLLLAAATLIPLLVLAYAYDQSLAASAQAAARLDLVIFVVSVSLLVVFLLAGQYWLSKDMAARLQEAGSCAAQGEVAASVAQGEFAPWLHSIQRLCRENERVMARAFAAVEEVEDAAGELSGFAGEGAKGSHRQGEAVASIASAMEQMVNSIHAMGSEADSTRQSSREAHRMAAEGAQVAQEAVQEIRGVSASVEATAAHVAQLDARSRQIDSIVHTIKSISEQTNLLALNAAIEAARAGEHGRGFAVVADEVRSLASNSHDAANEVEQQIQQVQQEIQAMVQEMAAVSHTVERGVDFVQRSGEALQNIEAGAAQAEAMISHMGDAVAELRAVSGDIARHVESINVMAIGNNEVLDEMALASQYVLGLSGKVRTVQA